MRQVLFRATELLRRPPVLVLAGALAAGGSALVFLPLFGVPGFELGLTLSIAVGLLGGGTGIAAVHQERRLLAGQAPGQALDSPRPDTPGRMAWRALAPALLLNLGAVVPPFLAATLYALVGTRCDPFALVGFYPLLTLPSAVLSAVAGVFCGFATRRWGRAVLLYLGLILLSALPTAWPIVFGPQVYAFNHFLGHMPGPLYDEALAISSALLWFRLETLLLALAVFALTVLCLDVPEARLRRPRLRAGALAVLGGVLVQLVAPRVLSSYLEYPLALGACCLLAALVLLRRPDEETLPRTALRVVQALLLLLVTGALGQAVMKPSYVIGSWRGFFGVVQLWESNRGSEDHLYILRHGIIMHGYQYTRPERKLTPTAYYTPNAGLGLALTEQRRRKEHAGLPPSLRVGVLGLGVGTTAALGHAGDTFRFYEINPQVIALAQGEGGYFSFLSDTPARVEVAEGDARILLEQELERGQAQGFDVLALDVFSSDSIPVHLFTEEAVDVYRRHLAPGGVLALHISNLHLELLPIVLAHAWTSGWHTTQVKTGMNGDTLTTLWTVLSPDASFSRGEPFLTGDASVHRLALAEPPRVRWTDERSSVLPLMAAFGVDHRDILQEQVESAAVAVPSGP